MPQPLSSHVFYGLDLGQRQDPSAFVILERAWELTGEFDRVTREAGRALRFRLYHAERLALGTPYVEIVERLRRLFESQTPRLSATPIPLSTPPRTLVVDASGVGRPVVELLRRAHLGCALAPITIMASGSPREESGEEFVPRRDLLANLRILMEKRLLRIASRIHDRDALIQEILRVRDASGSQHDDLVMTVALACWRAVRHLRL